MKQWMDYLVIEAIYQGFTVQRLSDGRWIFESWMGVAVFSSPKTKDDVLALALTLTRMGLYLPDDVEE